MNFRQSCETSHFESAAASAPDEKFTKRCAELGLNRYRRELLEIESGALPQFPRFAAWRKQWMGREHRRHSAIIYGHTDAGKSVMALWACRAVMRAGGWFDWIDTMEMPAILASHESWERLRSITRATLLVIDEVGDVDDLRGRAWAEIKNRINLRHRAERPTLLCSIADQSELPELIGPEVMRRFPLQFGSEEGGA